LGKKPLKIEEFLGPIASTYCLLNDENRFWLVSILYPSRMIFHRNLLMIFVDIRRGPERLGFLGMKSQRVHEREEEKIKIKRISRDKVKKSVFDYSCMIFHNLQIIQSTYESFYHGPYHHYFPPLARAIASISTLALEK
jgi:hypothetical protein